MRLVDPLTKVVHSLEVSGHDPTQLADTIWRCRMHLDDVDTQLHAFRLLPREGVAEERATLFANQVDQARGRLLRTIGELVNASKSSMSAGQDETGDPPFRRADELLGKAKEDVRSAETFAKSFR